MKRVIFTVLAIPTLLLGCGKSNQTVNTIPSEPNKSNWISSYSSATPTEYYVITDEKVTNVGKLIDNPNYVTHGPGGWATPNSNVMEIWTISGVDIHKAVAVKLKNDGYVRANAVGIKKP